MSTLQVIPEDRVAEVIDVLASSRGPAILSIQRPRGWRTFKVYHSLADRQADTIQLSASDERREHEPFVPDVGEAVGVSFRFGHKKCMFSTAIQAAKTTSSGFDVTLDWPKKISQLQRRAYERAKPPAGAVIPVRFWLDDAVASTGDEPRDVRHGQLANISAGGMSVQTAESTDVETDRSYRCIFSPKQGARSLIVDTTLRHREGISGRAVLGFQFVGLEATAEGRKQLERVARVVSRF